MAVNIHISGDNADEALTDLSILASRLTGAAPATSEPKTDKPARSSRSTTKPDPAKEEPPVQNPADPAGDEKETNETDDGPVPTVVELRAKAQEVGTTPEAKKAIKALLDEFGSKSISDVPDDQRNAFMSGLAGLAE